MESLIIKDHISYTKQKQVAKAIISENKNGRQF